MGHKTHMLNSDIPTARTLRLPLRRRLGSGRGDLAHLVAVLGVCPLKDGEKRSPGDAGMSG